LIKKLKTNAKDALRKYINLVYYAFFMVILISTLGSAQAVEIKGGFNSPGLSEAELKELAKGEWLIDQQKNPEGPWPLLNVVGFLPAVTTLESVAIYYALDHQKNYIPNMLESTPIQYLSPTEIHTRYRMKLPWPLDESRYVNGSKIFVQESSYRVEWFKIENDSAEKIEGYCVFVPYQLAGLTGSLMIYHTNVVPKSLFAGILKKLMVKDVVKSLQAVRTEIQKLKNDKTQTLLTQYSTYIVKSLQGEYVYASAKKP
jgi:hypothetical protein